MHGERHLPIGAECRPDGVHFRVWAPRRSRVEVLLADARAVELTAEGNGYFSGLVANAAAGSLYRFRLDGEQTPYPDPASRFQPEGPHGPSQVIDPTAFRWTDSGWRGVPPAHARVLYELHAGTFTREGNWNAAARELTELAHIGINVIELMPVADFPGEFGWGYDGVDLFAPTRLYGTPHELRAFVDRAHAAGIAVILDVVYNHFGPDGCYLRAFSEDYFTDRYDNEWGDPLNFDGDNAAPVREFFTANAAYWIDEYHFDGLRLDATQQIFDSSPEHIVAAVTRAVRRSARGRATLVVCENEPQDARLVRSIERGGYGADALWNDDFHHSARVALVRRNEAYYTDYRGTAQELLSCAKWGFLYQGQHYKWQKKRRGTPALDLPPGAFVHYLENHDQLANSARGERLHQSSSAARYRALTALLLLGPQTPMLFQGQEFAASGPFLYFADHAAELADSVREGRAKFLSQFPAIATLEVRGALADPSSRETFERCKLDLAERAQHAPMYALHCDLLRLRKDDAVFGAAPVRRVDGALLGPEALVVRFAPGEARDRLLIVNLGRDLELDVAPEPLLAPPGARGWRLIWSSEHPRYGGGGVLEVERDGRWSLPGEAAVVLAAEPER